MPLTLRVVKSIPRKVKGRFGKSRRGARSSPGNVGSGGTGIADQSCGPSTTSPYAKQSTRLTYLDLSEQVLSTLTTAAQVAPVPYLGSLSALALSIFKAVQGAKENQEALGELSKTACDFASFVLSTYQELHPSNTGSDVSQVQPSFSSDPTLNAHVEQLVKTLQNIDKWIKGVQSRKLVRRLISYKSDLRAIQNFRSHLGEAKDNFKVQSLIALRSSVTRTEQNDVTRHTLIQEQLTTMHEGMQILLIRSSPTSSTPVPPDSFESYPPINPGGSNTNIEFIECDTFGHAATKPNEVLAEDDSQPRSKSTQENVGRFGSTGIQGIEGNVLGHNYTGDLHDTVDSYIGRLLKGEFKFEEWVLTSIFKGDFFF